jgi:hypothetical protein
MKKKRECMFIKLTKKKDFLRNKLKQSNIIFVLKRVRCLTLLHYNINKLN